MYVYVCIYMYMCADDKMPSNKVVLIFHHFHSLTFSRFMQTVNVSFPHLEKESGGAECTDGVLNSSQIQSHCPSLSYCHCLLRGSVLPFFIHHYCGKLIAIIVPLPLCSATSTFWIANPNNNLINCAAAGSEVSFTLLLFTFTSSPTSPSPQLSPGGGLSHYHVARSD